MSATESAMRRVSFMDGLRARYAATDDSNTYDASAFLVGDASRRRNKKWEFVGMEQVRAKQSRLDRLEQVELRAMHISVAVHQTQRFTTEAAGEADPEQQPQHRVAKDGIAAAAPAFDERNEITEANLQRLRAVDLSENEELRLAELGKLVHYLPLLETLQLCDIPQLLVPYSAHANNEDRNNNNNNTRNDHDRVDTLSTNVPANRRAGVVALHYPPSPLLHSKRMTKLVLNNTGVVSCFQLRTLMELPHLQELHLDSNNLRSLDVYASQEEADIAAERGLRVVMPQVRTLSLAHNRLDAWIDEVDDEEGNEKDRSDVHDTEAQRRHSHVDQSGTDQSASRTLSTDPQAQKDGSASHVNYPDAGQGKRRGLSYTLSTVFPALRELYVGNNNLPNVVVTEARIARDARRRMAQLVSARSVPAVRCTNDEHATKHGNIDDTNNNNNTATHKQHKDSYDDGENGDDIGVADDRYAFIRQLTLLHINDNPRIDRTRSIDAIRVLCPALRALRVSYTHLFPGWNETIARMFVLASLPSLITLNRGDIRAKERLDADVLYIQRGMAQRQQAAVERSSNANTTNTAADTTVPSDSSSSCVGDYPLLDLLREKHKDLILSIYREDSSSVRSGEGDGAHVMLTLHLRCENCHSSRTERRGNNGGGGLASSAWRKPAAPRAGAFDSNGTICRTVPSNITIDKLKALIRVLFHVDPVNQLLTSQTSDMAVLAAPVELSNEMQTLSYYGVSSGDIITVRDSSLR